MIFFYSVSMVDYINAKIKMHVEVAEKLFKIGNYQVAILTILRWKCAISTGGGDFFDQEYIMHFTLTIY